MATDKEMWGFIAGLIDADGCISLNRGSSNRFNYVVVITNANKEVLEKVAAFLRGKLGTTIYKRSPRIQVYKRRKIIGTKDSYILQFHSAAILPLLKRIKDILIIKRWKALLVIRYLEIRKRKFIQEPRGKNFALIGKEEEDIFKEWKNHRN